MSEPVLQLHLDPDEPIEVGELTALLGSLSRQYDEFAEKDDTFARPSEARLLVSSVTPGSIDIAFQVDWESAASLMVPVIDQVGHLTRFAEHVRRLIHVFTAHDSPEDKSGVTVKNAEDAVNILKPVASHGGSQTINVIQASGNAKVILSTSAEEAKAGMKAAARTKAALLRRSEPAETRRGVALVWTQTARDGARTKGAQSPDRAVIEEIDATSKPVIFTDDTSHIKQSMMQDEENPYRKVYFVDVEVSRFRGSIVAYRVIDYHGNDPLPE